MDGKASPTVTRVTPAVIRCEHGCFAPLAQATALPVLAEAAAEVGVAALSLTGIHHFAALWPETEFLADRGLVGIACTAYMPMVAPAGSAEKLFGTNPISFACRARARPGLLRHGDGDGDGRYPDRRARRQGGAAGNGP